MKRIGKLSGIIACAAMAFIMSTGLVSETIYAEEGGTVIINGGENNASGATAAPDAYSLGNKVIIVAPTAAPVPTDVPQAVAGEDNNQSTASININNSDNKEVIVEEEKADMDYIVEDDDSDKKAAKATAKPKTTPIPKKNVNKSVSQKNEVTDKDDIPKTGVVHIEFVFAGVGIVLLLAATWMSVRYLKSDRH